METMKDLFLCRVTFNTRFKGQYEKVGLTKNQ